MDSVYPEDLCSVGTAADAGTDGVHRPYVAWSKAESELLRTLVQMHGTQQKWSAIAAQIPGRTSKQCRDRWVNHMKSSVKPDVWAPEEDFILACFHSKVGSKWSKIATALPGRTATSIKNHWNSTCRSKTLSNKRSLLCAYTTGLQSGLQPETAFQQATAQAKQEYLFTKLKSTLDALPSFAASCGSPGAAPAASNSEEGSQEGDTPPCKPSTSDNGSSTGATPTHTTGDDATSDCSDSDTTNIRPAPPHKPTAIPAPSTLPAAPPFGYPPAPAAFATAAGLQHLQGLQAPTAFQFLTHLGTVTVAPPTLYATALGEAAAAVGMEVTSASLSFDIDAMLASNPGLDPSLLPELGDEQGCLVQDLDGLSLQPPAAAAAPAAGPLLQLPASAAATLAAAAAQQQQQQQQLVGGMPTLLSPQLLSMLALQQQQQLLMGDAAGGALLGQRLLPAMALQQALQGVQPGTTYATLAAAAAPPAAPLLQALGGSAGEALVQELMMKSFKLGQRRTNLPGATGGGVRCRAPRATVTSTTQAARQRAHALVTRRGWSAVGQCCCGLNGYANGSTGNFLFRPARFVRVRVAGGPLVLRRTGAGRQGPRPARSCGRSRARLASLLNPIAAVPSGRACCERLLSCFVFIYIM